MKKILVFVLLLCICAGAYLYITSVKVTDDNGLASDFLPPDSVLYVQINDLEKQYVEFMGSPLGKAFLDIDYKSIDRELEDVDLPDDLNEDLDEFRKNFDTGKDLFFTLFGEDLSLGLLPLYNITSIKEIEQNEPEVIAHKFLSNVIGFSRLKINADIFELLNARMGKDQKLADIKHKEDVIHGYTLDPDYSLYLAIKDDYVLWALNPETVIQCLDIRSDDMKPSLSSNETFIDLKSKFPGDTSSFQYLSFETLVPRLETLFSEELADLSQGNEKLADMPFYKMLKSLKAVGSASYEETEAIDKTKSVTLFDKSKGDLSLVSAFSYKPEQSKVLELIPENSMLFTWNNYFDLNKYYLALSEQERTSASADLKNTVGVTLEEIVAAVGNEFFIFIKDINFGGLFPIPELAISLKINHNDVMDKLITYGLDMAKEQGGMNVETLDIEGVEYRYFPIPYGNDLTPGFAYIDEYFVIGINSNTIKNMLNARKLGTNILKDPRVVSVSKTDLNSNSVAFLDIGKGCTSLKSIFQWGSNMVGLAGADAAKEYQVITEKVVFPLLDGLQMYDSMGFRSWVEEESIIGDIRVKRANIVAK